MRSKAKHPAAQATATKGAGESATLPRDPPAHDEIAALAYACWEARGYQGASAEEDWAHAEEELRTRHAQLKVAEGAAGRSKRC